MFTPVSQEFANIYKQHASAERVILKNLAKRPITVGYHYCQRVLQSIERFFQGQSVFDGQPINENKFMIPPYGVLLTRDVSTLVSKGKMNEVHVDIIGPLFLYGGNAYHASCKLQPWDKDLPPPLDLHAI